MEALFCNPTHSSVGVGVERRVQAFHAVPVQRTGHDEHGPRELAPAGRARPVVHVIDT